MSLLTLLSKTIFKGLTNAIRQKMEIKNIRIEKEETKLSFFIGDMTVYIEYPKEKKNLLELITNDIQGCRTQVNIQKSNSPLYTSNV